MTTSFPSDTGGFHIAPAAAASNLLAHFGAFEPCYLHLDTAIAECEANDLQEVVSELHQIKLELALFQMFSGTQAAETS